MEMTSVKMEITYDDGSVLKCIIKDMRGTITKHEGDGDPTIELFGTVYEPVMEGEDQGISGSLALIRMIRM